MILSYVSPAAMFFFLIFLNTVERIMMLFGLFIIFGCYSSIFKLVQTFLSMQQLKYGTKEKIRKMNLFLQALFRWNEIGVDEMARLSRNTT